MVTFKVDTNATAIVQGSEDLEKHPLVAKVKGTGKDGALSVQVSGEGGPISARVSGDRTNPLAVGPIEVSPITIIPDLQSVAKTVDFASLIGAISKLSQGVNVQVGNSGKPLAIALGKIPVDLTISVSSPAQEAVFKVEIKGTIGE
ncbi:MAG TPA: hypothetical protein PKK11_06720 [Methanothrix sp.]|nr:hypothetical protein [Methanothrix sp.]